MARDNLPEKILIIKDCTFILPDDFEGTTEEAFTEFLKYQAEHAKNARFVDRHNLLSTFSILLHTHKKHRVCGEYAIYKLVDGRYELMKAKDTEESSEG